MSAQTAITLSEAVRLGEYRPETLSQYPEWNSLSRFAQFQMISSGIDNRKRLLMQKWAEVINFMDDNGDPKYREETKINIENQIKKLREEKEVLYWQYLKEEDEE